MRIIENKQTETEVVLKVELDDTRYNYLRLQFNGQTYSLYDQYCVNPSCNCSETVITFYPVIREGGDRGIAAISYGYSEIFTGIT